MQQVKTGDTVFVHYEGRLKDGTVFDSSSNRDPLEFKVGSGMVIRGFDQGVLGMSVGDKKTIEINVDDAYGPEDPQMIIEFPKDRFPENIKPTEGMQLNMSDANGQNYPFLIVEVKDDLVVLDGNHPLAGEDLIFDLELMEIKGGSLIILPD
jgi:FKBP-type peptidyl-prolyl cis-trans isomerase 2